MLINSTIAHFLNFILKLLYLRIDCVSVTHFITFWFALGRQARSVYLYVANWQKSGWKKISVYMCIILSWWIWWTEFFFILQRARELCPHHVGHYLGMDVHDTAEVPRSIKLQSGMIVTIEPGLLIILEF